MPRFFTLALCLFLLSGCGSIIIDGPSGALTPAPAPVSVPVAIEITKSVYGRSFVITGPGSPVTLTTFTTTPKAGVQNTDILTTTVSLAAGSYTLTASGTYDQWNGAAQPISTSSSFTVTASTSISLTLTPAGDILVPRGGQSAMITFDITRNGVTGAAAITSSNLPSGVTLPATSVTAASASASLSAIPTANGQALSTFVATLGTTTDQQKRNVVVVPATGTFAWVAAPFLTATGPQTPTSADGKWTLAASRVGFQRVWTLDIKPPTAASPHLPVTAAQWGGAGGSNLAGLAFCPTSPTLSALVLSDEDEDPNVGTHQAGVTYRLKVIRFDSGTPQQQGSIDGLKYLNAVQPRLGFSSDCSIVAGWSIDPVTSSQRNVTFFDIFNGRTVSWSYTDTATQPPAGLVSISGTTITLNGPSGQHTTLTVP